ncbi:MAG: GH1 family beta-glucosidase [Velocimicrobium sp.]
MNFPNNFIWGAASSSYQIEGGFDADGKGLSIWDIFTHRVDRIAHNQNGDIACNHYYDFEKDIALLKELGIPYYRLSISWPRIFPNGDKEVNKLGLQFYDTLIDQLLLNHITPYITLYHWDLPQILEDIGGWKNRDIVDIFADYSAFITEHFSDRVTNFITINEPQCIASLGYSNGIHAPGKTLPDLDVFQIFHHLALAHGAAVKKMRQVVKQTIHIGLASTGNLCFPQTESKEDIQCAKELSFQVTKENWTFSHSFFCDAIILGKYPDVSHIFGEAPYPFIKKGDMEQMAQPIDFFAVNVYNGHEVSASYQGHFVPKYNGFPRTALKWPITPGVMNWGMRFLYERYKLPLIITENGISCNDKLFSDGLVHDLDRIDFLERYLIELEKAVHSDAKIIGYFQWSLTDNFEWNNGYEERFGLIYIDYRDQTRHIKDSAYWYSNIIKKSTNS